MEINIPTYFQEFSYIKHANNQLTMHKYLITKAFKKAKEDLINRGKNNPSAVNISEEVESKTGFKIGAKMYRIYYSKSEKILNANKEEKDINITQENVVQGLFQYLGFESYTDFVDSLPVIKKRNNNGKVKTVTNWI